MTFPYQRGHIAAIRGLSPDACPYAGKERMQWLEGHYVGWQEREHQAELFARRCVHLTRRKTVRHRWPRSTYARNRLQQILREST